MRYSYTESEYGWIAYQAANWARYTDLVNGYDAYKQSIYARNWSDWH